MAKQTILVGTNPNDKSGDLLRNAFIKTNSNFTEVYNAISASTINPTFTGVVTMSGATSVELPSGYLEKFGTNYVLVSGKGNPTENAAELQSAYDVAKTMPRYLDELDGDATMTVYKGQTWNFPGTSYLSILQDITGNRSTIQDNSIAITEEEAKSVRTTVIVSPGYYTFGSGNTFTISGETIDVVSLTGNQDVILDGINVFSKNVYLKGINIGSNIFFIQGGLSDLVIENCKGGDNSFGCRNISSSVSSTFINCEGGNSSFGGGQTYYENESPISPYSRFSGYAINCKAGNYSFGGGDGDSVGIFSGKTINCEAGIFSFGGYGTLTEDSVLENCKAGDYSFGNVSCIGTLKHCTGGLLSFGQNGQTTGGQLEYCKLTTGNFEDIIVEEGGKIINCINDDGSIYSNVLNTSIEPNGKNYVMVYGVGTPEENALELKAAYDAAKNMPRFLGELGGAQELTFYKGQTFYENDLSLYHVANETFTGTYGMGNTTEISETQAKSVRTTVIVAPGDYNLLGETFTIDNPSINVVSLTGNADINILYSGVSFAISITEKNILIKGLSTSKTIFVSDNTDTTTVLEKCKGDEYSYINWDSTCMCTAINCEILGTLGMNWAMVNLSGGGRIINCINPDGSIFNSVAVTTNTLKISAASYTDKAAADADITLLSGTIYKITATGVLMIK